jgi:hypothetical protein
MKDGSEDYTMLAQPEVSEPTCCIFAGVFDFKFPFIDECTVLNEQRRNVGGSAVNVMWNCIESEVLSERKE